MRQKVTANERVAMAALKMQEVMFDKKLALAKDGVDVDLAAAPVMLGDGVYTVHQFAAGSQNTFVGQDGDLKSPPKNEERKAQASDPREIINLVDSDSESSDDDSEFDARRSKASVVGSAGKRGVPPPGSHSSRGTPKDSSGNKESVAGSAGKRGVPPPTSRGTPKDSSGNKESVAVSTGKCRAPVTHSSRRTALEARQETGAYDEE